MGSTITAAILYILQLLALPYQIDAIRAPHKFKALFAPQSNTTLSINVDLPRPRDPHVIVDQQFRIVFARYNFPIVDPWDLSACIFDATVTAFHAVMYKGRDAPLPGGAYRCDMGSVRLSIHQDVRNFSYYELVTLVEAIYDFSYSYTTFGMNVSIYDRENLLLGHGSISNSKNLGPISNVNVSTIRVHGGPLVTGGRMLR